LPVVEEISTPTATAEVQRCQCRRLPQKSRDLNVDCHSRNSRDLRAGCPQKNLKIATQTVTAEFKRSQRQLLPMPQLFYFKKTSRKQEVAKIIAAISYFHLNVFFTSKLL
jgi:hypothetical protein